jgi:hypothetical protein
MRLGAILPVSAASPSARTAREVLSCEQEGAICSGKKVHVQDQEAILPVRCMFRIKNGVLEQAR